MSESFQHILFTGTCRVLGRDLPPLTLWSLSVLQAIQSPFLSLSTDTEFTLADLQVAVKCALTPALQPPNLKPTRADWWHHLRHRKSTKYLEQQAAAFVSWLLIHQKTPALWAQETEGTPRYISAPLELSYVSALMALGMTHAEAWSCSPAYAAWLTRAHDERTSDAIRFVDEEEDEQLAAELDEAELKNESDIIAQAREDLPPAAFERWLSARNTPTP